MVVKLLNSFAGSEEYALTVSRFNRCVWYFCWNYQKVINRAALPTNAARKLI